MVLTDQKVSGLQSVDLFGIWRTFVYSRTFFSVNMNRAEGKISVSSVQYAIRVMTEVRDFSENGQAFTETSQS